MGGDEREISGMKQLPFDFTPDEDLEQRRRVIWAQQTILRELATRLDHIIEDYKSQQEVQHGVE